MTFKLSQTDCASNLSHNTDEELPQAANSNFNIKSKSISFQAPITIDSSIFANLIVVGGGETGQPLDVFSEGNAESNFYRT